jgi:hypothetical protein
VLDAINNNKESATLGGDLPPSFDGRGAHPRLSLSPPHDDLAAAGGRRHCGRWR